LLAVTATDDLPDFLAAVRNIERSMEPPAE
jgi:hypothetical protein